MKNSMKQLEFTALNGKKLTAVFDEPEMTSDFGVLLLREVENHGGFIKRFATAIKDGRHQSYTEHSYRELLRQRVFQICSGYEDADDCDHFRGDVAFKVAAGRDPLSSDLASQPTMSRLENAVTIKDLLRVGYVFIDIFLDSYVKEPEVIVLDMDPTANICHGHQQLSLFNAFEDEYCLMPFHVYEGLTGKFITTVIRGGKTPTAIEIIRVLKRIVGRIRQRWPNVRIIFRADSHHTKPEVMAWLEEHGVEFITALSKNAVLDQLFSQVISDAQARYKRLGRPVTLYASRYYAAGTWNRHRRVICRVKVSSKDTDVRYVVTSFKNTGAKYLYEKVYCARGKMELMIKDHKVALNSKRSSCHSALANQFRLLVHSAAYVIMHALRETVLRSTEFANAQFDTIRLRLLKVGARVEAMRTRIRFHLPVHFPFKEIYQKVALVAAALKT